LIKWLIRKILFFSSETCIGASLQKDVKENLSGWQLVKPSFLTITEDVPCGLDGRTLSPVKCSLNFCQSVQFSIAVLHNNFKV